MPQKLMQAGAQEARSIFQQLILALDFCHKRGIANRDLKMENLLLSSSTDTPLRKAPSVKLCDFGCACPRMHLNSDRCSV